MLDIILLVLGAISFAVKGFGPILGITVTKVDLTAVGLFCWILTLLI